MKRPMRIPDLPGRLARSSRLVALLLVAGLLAACAGSGGSGGKRASTGAGDAGSATGPAAQTGSPRRGGGYYLDDGPGDAPPANLDAIADAVPRFEPVLARTSRPYTVFGRQYQPMARLEPFRQRGVASWYGRRYHGNPTSSGERYDMYAMTAAHPILPIPSYVRVRNLRNDRSVVLRVNDRGPFLNNRVIDLSYTAAAKLDFVAAGSAEVEVELITEFGEPGPANLAQASPPAVQPLGAPSTTTVQPVAVSTRAAAAQPVAGAAAQMTGAGEAQSEQAAVPPSQPAMTQPSEQPVLQAERLTVETEVRESMPVAAVGPDPAGGGAQRAVADGGTPAVQAPDAAGARRASAGTPVPQLERGYWLQFGAFGSADNAHVAREGLMRRITGLGAALDVVADGGLYKLQAGPWPTREAARAAADRVAAASDLKPFTTQR